MTVERLENEMSANEYDEWLEFYLLEPFGDEERMNDLRSAKICSMVAGSAGADMPPSEFVIYKNKAESEESVEDWESKLLRAITTT